MTARLTIKALLAPAVAAAALWPVAVTPGVACAGELPRAALVVDTGADVLNYCVTLPDESVSGMELIELASEQHGLRYKLGFGGGAVCMLAGVGPTGSDCFEDDPDFWGYWRGDGSGGWTWSSAGATATSVDDGDVEGWAWGSGTGPDTHSAPPEIEFGAVCALPKPPREDQQEEAPRPEEPDREARTGGMAAGADEAAAPEFRRPQPAQRSGDARGRDRKSGLPARLSRAPAYGSGAPAEAAPASAEGPRAAPLELASNQGPPVGGIVALVATVALGAAGAVLGRRRRGAP